ncbi:SRPBCC family protein [Micromonospora sp. CPCC 206061]|uniref:SRPBCC family protein n=1 Tax=Micromonospora sp. CPCC 206061 TaxID=3122410 RepID=UPI002FF3426D
MRLDHSFTVPVDVDEAWRVLLDVPRVAPCMPGAALTEFDGEAFTGTVKVKVGPIVLTYTGKGRFVERDDAAHRVVIEASGRDTRAAGTASATVTAVLVPDGDRTRVEVATDLVVTGRPAQFGRGMLADVGGRLVGQFADCLASEIAAPVPDAPQPVVPDSLPDPAEPSEPAPAEATSTPSADGIETTPAAIQPAATAVSPAAVLRPVEPEREVEPIDLLKLSAGTRTARYAGLVGLAAVAAVATWFVIRALRG